MERKGEEMNLKEGNLLAEALNQYSFQQPQVKMIRHNENQTYQVIDGQNQYLLRIHLPIDGFSVEEKLKTVLNTSTPPFFRNTWNT